MTQAERRSKTTLKEPMQRLQKYNSLFLILAILAILGFLLINVPFLYYVLWHRDVYAAAMGNNMSLVFMTEALLLMFLLAFLIAKNGLEEARLALFHYHVPPRKPSLQHAFPALPTRVRRQTNQR